ncbi:hypothetical protein D3C71_965070 [compost metagenome]
MCCPNGIISTTLHIDYFPFLYGIRCGITDIGITLMSIGTDHIKMFAINKESSIFGIPNLTDTDLICTAIHFDTIGKIHPIFQVIADRMIGMPQLRIFDIYLLVYPATFLRFQLK